MARTTALNKIEATFREPTFYKVIQGGTGAGKTYANMTLCISYAESFPGRKVDVVGMSYPQLDGDAIAIFLQIMREQHHWSYGVWNDTKHRFAFPNGSKIQFLSVDKMGAHGPRRHLLYCPEANSMPWAVFDQLATRTKDKVLLDFNPTYKFWAHDELMTKRPEETSHLILTYKDNEALSPREIKNIESHKPGPGEEPSNWWIVYGLGQIGSLEGNVYSGWIEGCPVERAENGVTSDRMKLVRYGLDFGFSNDETAMVAVYEIDTSIFQDEASKQNKSDSNFCSHVDKDMNEKPLFVQEIIYQKGLLGSQYPVILEKHAIQHDTLIVADSARPEIIAEIKAAGFRIIGADKNAGSVLRGIDAVKFRQIYYSGPNLKREYLSYAWRTKRTGETVDEPQDGNDHLMDALRYAVDDLSKKPVSYGSVRL